MPQSQRRRAGNRLLRTLPKPDLQRFLDGCDTVPLAFSDVLCTANEHLTHVFFPTDGCISLLMPIDASTSMEVGLVGNEGMFGSPLVLGLHVSFVHAMVQGPGSALRMESARFGRELAQSQALQERLDRYVFVQLSQLAQTAACTRFHVVEARLARWLLMTQDRSHANHFRVTQEFLAIMLGVRRVGVTKAAIALQKRNLIHYSRGNITVVDRRGLRAASCGCYKADRDAYDRTLGVAVAGAR